MDVWSPWESTAPHMRPLHERTPTPPPSQSVPIRLDRNPYTDRHGAVGVTRCALEPNFPDRQHGGRQRRQQEQEAQAPHPAAAAVAAVHDDDRPCLQKGRISRSGPFLDKLYAPLLRSNTGQRPIPVNMWSVVWCEMAERGLHAGADASIHSLRGRTHDTGGRTRGTSSEE